jgi:large subunit ribosomal protein L21
MYAVIQTGGKQYRVQKGDELFIEKLEVEAGDAVDFDKVLVVSDDDNFEVGKPYIEMLQLKLKSLKMVKDQK